MPEAETAAFKPGDIVHLTLSALVAPKDNPRKTREKSADPVLVGSIRSRGLLQNLGVRPSETTPGKFEVKYGARRLAALKALLKEGHFTKETTFPCRIASENPADWAEEQLAENVARLAMNPVDEFEAFARLEEQGLSVDEIAARFGADPRAVRQRLALGQAAPCVRKALRDEEITLEIAKLFAGCPDVARQERIFRSLAKNGSFSAYSVKRALHEGTLESTDNLVRFVGIDAYKAAGGAFEDDLFNGETRLLDVELVHRLRDEKLAREVERLSAEGWSWVEAHEGYSHQLTNGYDRLYGARIAKTPEEESEIKTLENEMEAFEQGDEDAMTDEDWDRYEAIEARLDALRTEGRAFTVDQKSVSGCILYPRGEGIERHEGLIRKEDRKKVAALRKEKAERAGDAGGAESEAEDFSGVDLEGEDDGAAGPEFGIGLTADLASFKAQALQAAIATEPKTAILAHQFILVRRVFNKEIGRWPSGCNESASAVLLRVGNGALGETIAAAMLDRREREIRTDIFAEGGWREAWAAFKALTDAERAGLVAFAFARTIEATTDRQAFMALVASELDLDIRAFWNPTAENFFARVRKDQLMAFLVETVGEAEAARLSGAGKAKKSELVQLCDGLISGKTPVPSSSAKDRIDAWAPAPMRFDPPPPADEDDFDGDDDGLNDSADNAVMGDADDE
jgi:ParB family transcriptional regulator, chromosome partitioning protein